MKSNTTEKFRGLLADLPAEIRKQAKVAYIQFCREPYYPGLRFNRVHSKRPIYSVRSPGIMVHWESSRMAE